MKFSEELSNTEAQVAAGITVSDQTGGSISTITAKQDKTDKTKYVVTVDQVLDSASTVTFAANTFTDLSGTQQANSTVKVLNFVQDTVAPKIASTAVVKDATTGKEYLDITFDKNVDLTSAKVEIASGSYVKNYLTTALVAGTQTDIDYKDAAESKKVLRVALSDLLDGNTDVDGASYSTKLTFTGVSSEAGVAISTALAASFARTTDTIVSTDKELLATSAVQGSDNNKVVIQFSKPVDPQTATTAANYTVQGAVVKSAEVSAADTTKVILTLADNSNANTGNLKVTVTNVKNADKSRTVTPANLTASLTENVAPTVTKAELTNLNQVKLTFSEPVYFAADAFVLYLGDTVVPLNSLTAVAKADATKTVTLDITTPLTATELASTAKLVVKPVDGADVQDANDNYLDFTSIEVPKAN